MPNAASSAVNMAPDRDILAVAIDNRALTRSSGYVAAVYSAIHSCRSMEMTHTQPGFQQWLLMLDEEVWTGFLALTNGRIEF